MESRIEERVENWGSRPFSGGYEGLRELSSAEFSGAVRAGGASAFMLNGRIVGVFDGTIGMFEDADGTIYDAPHPSLPLLYTMQQQAGEPRAEYYTNDTPISEVDQTLSSGTFTGYVELSDNVLSGDYYQVYYGGRSMSAAFVGNSEKLLTDDEAFERADDEVGIYQVYEVDIDIVEVPDEDPDDEPAAGTADDADDQANGAVRGQSRSEPPTESNGRARSDSGARSDNRTQSDPGTRPDETPRRDSGARATENGRSEGASTDSTEIRDAEADTSRGGRRRESTADEGHPDRRPEGDRRDRAAQEDRRDRPADGDRARRQERGASDQREDGRSGRSEPRRRDDRNAGDRPPRQDERDSARRRRPGQSGSNVDRTEDQPHGDRGNGGERRSGKTDRRTQSNRSDRESADGRRESSRRNSRTSSSREDQATGRRPTDSSTTGASSRTGAGDSAARRRSKPDTGENGGSTGKTPATNGPNGDVDANAGTASVDADLDEADTIPALDPDRTAQPDEDDAGGGDEATVPGAQAIQFTDDGEDRIEPDQPEARAPGTVDQPIDEEVFEREDHIDELEQRLSNLEAERDDLRAERDELARTVDRIRDEKADLQAEIDHLESELAELEAEVERLESQEPAPGSVANTTAGPSLSRTDALSGTDLFVRYRSKSDATLEDVHAGDATPEEVNDNLRLEHHTRFESEDATVDGQDFDAFLRRTLEYRFVEWFVTQLPYEIRDTGHVDGLKDLYAAYPNIDRAELDAEVTLKYQEDSEEVREQQAFDVVIRDRMGNPLVVANLNDSRDPATQEMLVDLKETADKLKEGSESLGAAVMVTKSFFAPGALETASEATSGGLLSRDSRESYVKLSRKRGYHLCLVEARGDDFHLNVPEL